MKKLHFAAWVAFGIFLAGCNPTIVRSGSANDDAQAKLFVPDPARALVYVYRDNSFLGRDLESQLVIDNLAVATNERGRFIVVSLKPGAYKLLSISAKESNGLAMLTHNSRKTPVAFTAEAGKVYFFQDVFTPLGGFSLKAVPASDAETVIAKEKLLARYER